MPATTQVRVLVAGSSKHLENDRCRQDFDEFCQAVGKRLANTEITIIVGSTDIPTADRQVLIGANQVEAVKNIRVITRTEDVHDGPTFSRLGVELPNLDLSWATHWNEEWPALRRRQVEEADIVLLVGGSIGTSNIAEEAKRQSKLVIPIGAAGGVAEGTFDSFSPDLKRHAVINEELEVLRKAYYPIFVVELLQRLGKMYFQKNSSSDTSPPISGEHRDSVTRVADQLSAPVVVLMAVNDHETHALLDAFLGPKQAPESVSRGGVTYNDLGVHGGLRVIHSLCEMGAGGIGAAQQRAQDAINHWQPRAVIAVGIAFGIDETKQQIGDVLVSVQLQNYDLARVNEDGTLTPRGDKAHAADTLVNRFGQTDVRCCRSEDSWPKVRFGLVLSGQKLVDNLDYRESLKRLAPEAIGGEMEGTGLYTSAQRAGAHWLVVKAICDWGHNKNQADKDARQKTAAANAARVVKAALDAGDLYPLAAAELPKSVTAPRGELRRL